MSVVMNKRGNTWKEITYRVLSYDPDDNILDHGEYTSKIDAIKRAKTIPNAEVEQVTRWYPMRRHEATYRVIWP